VFSQKISIRNAVLFVFGCLLISFSTPLAAQESAPVAPVAQETVQPPPAALDAPTPVGAETAETVDILPAKSLSGQPVELTADEATHPPIKMTPDKSELIRLDAEAGTVIVGNPLHLSVVADSANTLVLVPRQPGATYVVVLDRKGNVLMQRHVIVASPKEKYVRIRKSCVNSEKGTCQATQVYYCPDMCHEIGMPPAGEESDSAPADADALQADNQGDDEAAEETGTQEEGTTEE
jgi:hypothetical protein